MAIEVINRQRVVPIDSRRIANLAEAALVAMGRALADITVIVLRDHQIRKLNYKFRRVDRPTDVLSFPVGDDPGASQFLGDIAISADTALRQAKDAGHSCNRELDELVIHGVLHLCGYDHETDDGQMNRLELTLRTKLLDRAIRATPSAKERCR